jgi:hypothetical protein
MSSPGEISRENPSSVIHPDENSTHYSSVGNAGEGVLDPSDPRYPGVDYDAATIPLPTPRPPPDRISSPLDPKPEQAPNSAYSLIDPADRVEPGEEN